ncbi:Rossmann-fold NAD(P)-binding domain-containing protein [Cytobacillus massiliigabonensis]|uniref:hypothetical protein n=1 Tax=Cytobacillus massiliigabonensis TaxID=1871011 RepID=UPI000C81C340|nr:hypothetical protein [Cytobacillus massiliigabonensis]
MKRYLLNIVFMVIAGMVAGCTNQTAASKSSEVSELKKKNELLSHENKTLKNTVKEQEKALEEATLFGDAIILTREIEKYPRSIYKEAAFDIDMDGEDEMIQLYVNAERMENGLFAWDDGQTWLLAVKDGEKTYPLYDNYVQLGSIDFSTAAFDVKKSIVMLEMWHSDKAVYKFTYDDEAKGFVKETLYKRENPLQQYNQHASYAFFNDAYEIMKQAFTDKTLKALEASENKLQELNDRAAIIDPIVADIGNAQRLFDTVSELNPELNVSLSSVYDLLNQMVINPPTVEQMNQLKGIHELFKDTEGDSFILEEENQIHPELKKKLQRLESILIGKK